MADDHLDGTMLLNTIPNRWLKDLKGKLHHSSLDRLEVAISRFINVRGEPLYTPVEIRQFRPAKSPVKELCRDLGQKGFNLGTFIEILRDAKLDSYADKLCSHIETARQSTCCLILQQCIIVESAALPCMVVVYKNIHLCTICKCERSKTCLKDHLHIKTTVGWLIVHFSCIEAPLYKDHLSTETTVNGSLE
jgi:hypothetical protein